MPNNNNAPKAEQAVTGLSGKSSVTKQSLPNPAVKMNTHGLETLTPREQKKGVDEAIQCQTQFMRATREV